MGGDAARAGTVVGVMDSTSPTDGTSGSDPAEAADDAEGEEAAPETDARPARRRRLDRRTIAICVCVALVAALAAGLATSVLTGDDGSPAPDQGLDLSNPVDTDTLLDVDLLTVEGAKTSLRDHLADRPVVVNIWAQSCPPCVTEMPLLEQLHQDRPDIDVLGVDTQDRLDLALPLAAKTGITYPWFQDPSGDFFYAAEAAGMPTTLLVNPAGAVMAVKTGEFKDAADLDDWIERYVGPPAS